MKKQKTLGISLVVTGILCIAAAGILWGIQAYEETRAGKDTEILLAELNREMKIREDELIFDTVKAEEPVQGEMPQIQWSGYNLMGVLGIPCLEMELPVMNTWDYDLVKIAPCRYSGSINGNDLILLAHNYKRHFGPLKRLEIGDVVNVTDVNGVITAYEVAKLETLEKTELDRLTSSDYPLTLFTCTSGGQARLVIRCQLM